MDVLGFTVPLWLILIVVIIILYIYSMSRHHGTFKKLGIPGPAPTLVLGSFADISKLGIRDFYLKCMKKYGKVFGYYGGFRPQSLVIADKEILRQLLVKEFANFTDRVVLKGFNGDMETSINNLSGDHWKHVRSKMSPAFSTGKLRRMIPLIDEASDTLITSLRRNVKKSDGVVEMMDVFGNYAMDVICSTAFGIQVDSQSDPKNEFVANAKRFLNISFSSPILIILIFFPKLRFMIPTLGMSFVPPDVQAFFRSVTTKILNERVAGQKDRVDFLQLMKNVQLDKDDSDDDSEDDNDTGTKQKTSTSWSRKGVTFSEILGNAEIFFIAGYETTTITLAMCSYYLALYPEFQDKLRDEVNEKLGSGKLTYENIRDIEYLDMVVNETLRIHPPATLTDRVCIRDTEIHGLKIPAGMNISIPIDLVHHDPDNWEDPEKFDPERFAPERKPHLDPITFLPFGYGPRNCIGKRLALTETKMSLSKIVRNFKMSVCTETQIPPELGKFGILKPKSVSLKLEEIK